MDRENPAWGEEQIANELLLKLEIGSRRILHTNVTPHPAAEWINQRFREFLAFDHPSLQPRTSPVIVGTWNPRTTPGQGSGQHP